MGYNLAIGEFHADIDADERRARATARPVSGGVWSASYSGWAEAMGALGLRDLFLGVGGRKTEWPTLEGQEVEPILYSHPGAVALTEAHVRAFEAAAERWRNARAAKLVDPSEHKAIQGVADWLAQKGREALSNCEHPTFANS